MIKSVSSGSDFRVKMENSMNAPLSKRIDDSFGRSVRHSTSIPTLQHETAFAFLIRSNGRRDVLPVEGISAIAAGDRVEADVDVLQLREIFW